MLELGTGAAGSFCGNPAELGYDGATGEVE